MSGGEAVAVSRLSAIAVIDEDHPDYDQFDVTEESLSPRRQSTAFYNELLDAYNEVAVGSIMVIPLPSHVRFFNMKNVLEGRGLKHGIDFLLVRMDRDESGELIPKGKRPAKLKKLSETVARHIDIYEKRDDHPE